MRIGLAIYYDICWPQIYIAYREQGVSLATPVLEIDTNGTWGLSHLSACERVRVEGTQLVYDEAPASCITDTSEGRLSPVPNDNNSLTGAWALDTATAVQAQHFVFWADGRYLMVDAIGDTAEIAILRAVMAAKDMPLPPQVKAQ